MDVGIEATKLTIKKQWEAWIITNVSPVKGVGSCANRMEYARIMLEKYPELED